MNKLVKRICLLFLLSGLGSVSAQQIPQYSQFMVNPYLVNPALAGAEGFMDFKLGYRNQWTGFDGAPKTMYVSGHSPIGKTTGAQTHKGDYHNWHGVGGFVYRDEIGPWSSTSINLNYAYNMKLTDGEGFGTHHKDGLRLSIGTFMGYNMNRISSDKLVNFNGNSTVQDREAYIRRTFGGDPTLNAFNGKDLRKNKFDMSLGALLYYREVFYVGFSTFQALGSSLFAETNNERHFLTTASYKAEVGDYIYVMPSALIKMAPGAPVSVDLNVRIDYHDMFFGGISYRHQDAVTLMAGTLIELQEKAKHFRKGKHRYGLELFYSYDFTLSEIKTYSSGTHEITLGFRLPPMLMERNAESTWR